MLATLSRWRSWVQIPSRTLIDKLTRYAIWQSGEAQIFVVCGFDSHPRHCIGSCSPRRPVKPLSENKWGGDERFNSFTTHSTRPVLLAVQDAGPSSRRRGFKSRTGHFSTTRPSGATGRHATLRTSCPLRAWEFESPLGHCRWGRCPTGFHKAGIPGSIPGPAI